MLNANRAQQRAGTHVQVRRRSPGRETGGCCKCFPDRRLRCTGKGCRQHLPAPLRRALLLGKLQDSPGNLSSFRRHRRWGHSTAPLLRVRVVRTRGCRGGGLTLQLASPLGLSPCHPGAPAEVPIGCHLLLGPDLWAWGGADTQDPRCPRCVTERS